MLERVSFAYPESPPVLRDLSLCVARGEQVAILGANGSGKSSLLRLLDALVYPSAGRFVAFGEEVTEAALRDQETSRRFRRRVGLVFQNADAQLFCPTVREDLAFGPLQLGLSPAEVERRVADVAAMLGMGALLDRAPFHLSGGEKRKAAIGGVLAANPDVLLLDEPTSGLDPRSQWWLVETLQALGRAGKTIVLATHDLELVPLVTSRAVILGEDHALLADAEPEALLGDRDLLLGANLIHAHSHRHGTIEHVHTHHHAGDHAHEHD
ncbi:MAG: ABC transporter ATP-binding protein [Chthonomonadales bacterium]|nr:ABC transporter ATP-binding protein [Chthonomonadales bacterium]